MDNKTTLQKANACVSRGDYDGFLEYCTEDTKWIFVGEQVLRGKAEVRQYMAEAYIEPPKFEVETLVAEGDFVTAVGTISMKNENGKTITYDYCDVWRLRNGRLAELRAFVIEKGSSKT